MSTDVNASGVTTDRAQANLRWLRSGSVTIARVLLLLLVAILLARVRSESSILVHVGVGVICVTAIYLAVGTQARIWSLYIVGFIAFVQLRAYADDIGTPVQYEYPIVAERVLFLGKVPVNVLQNAFYSYQVLGPLEVFTILVYFSYFIVPHVVAVTLFLTDKRQFTRYVLAYLCTLFIALVVHAVLPTAPPWIAGQEGQIPHVYHVVSDISGTVAPGSYEQGYELTGANAFAAMPSLHAAVPWLITIALWRRPLWRWLALSYALSMSFTLVYLGEHYFVDSLAGLAAASFGWIAARALMAGWARGREAEPETDDPSVAPPPRSAIVQTD